jgi:hypothetical protein
MAFIFPTNPFNGRISEPDSRTHPAETRFLPGTPLPGLTPERTRS